jgi:hypothetical protein
VAAQLRSVLAAEQSAEVAEEDQDHRAISPQLTQTMAAAVGTGELDLLKPFEIHAVAH